MANSPWPFPSPDAEVAFFEDLRQKTPGLVARHLNKRISIPLSRRLLPYPITPNQITVGHTLIGIMGLILVPYGTYWTILVGSILLWFSTVLDGCDGEVARAKGMCTTFGKYLDTTIDYLKTVAYAVVLCFGVARQTGNPLYHSFAWAILFGCLYLILSLTFLTSRVPSAKGTFNVLEAGFDKSLQKIPFLGTFFLKTKFAYKNDFLALFFVVMAIANLNVLLIWLTLLLVGVEILVLSWFIVESFRRDR